ncbi:hypothetical protein DBV15_05658 [Temnothorax longispinosus]|uniref:Uncharacterized protein n=1 Tax=Temnothorax longispinosus TaxID=300112 RepID=A0A4S2JN72_9HYME|nr:hypothetical protein DBV15_05658 [Temnothorax longispinosus]
MGYPGLSCSLRVKVRCYLTELTVNFRRSMFTHNALLDEDEVESALSIILIIIKFVISSEKLVASRATINSPGRGSTDGSIPRFCCVATRRIMGKRERRKIHNYRPRASRRPPPPRSGASPVAGRRDGFGENQRHVAVTFPRGFTRSVADVTYLGLPYVSSNMARRERSIFPPRGRHGRGTCRTSAGSARDAPIPRLISRRGSPGRPASPSRVPPARRVARRRGAATQAAFADARRVRRAESWTRDTRHYESQINGVRS